MLKGPPTLEQALAAHVGGELVVIGGADLYRQVLPRAQTIHLTRVHARVAGGRSELQQLRGDQRDYLDYDWVAGCRGVLRAQREHPLGDGHLLDVLGVLAVHDHALDVLEMRCQHLDRFLTDPNIRAPSNDVILIVGNDDAFPAARAAIEQVAEKRVELIEAIDLAQAFAAMVAYSDGRSLDDNVADMRDALQRTHTGRVTIAVRERTTPAGRVRPGDAMGFAGSVGIWLFYVQHQFEGVYWERADEWDYTAAALQGSSFYKLPRILQWFSGNIGYHHIHHLSPRIPNYKLEKCHNDNPEFQIQPLTIQHSLKSLFFRLWDEKEKMLVGWSALKKYRAERVKVKA